MVYIILQMPDGFNSKLFNFGRSGEFRELKTELNKDLT